MGKTYEQGLEDAWEVARKIAVPISKGGYTITELGELFGRMDYEDILSTFSGKEAFDRVKKYEEKQNELVIGDIVSVAKEPGSTTFEAIYYGETVSDFWVLTKDKPVPQCLYKRSWILTKTGRHVDMQSLFDAI